MPPMTRGSFADLINVAMSKIIDTKWKEWKELQSQLFNQRTSDRNEEKESLISGLGYLGVKTEGAPIAFSDLVQGYDKTYTPVVYALGAEVTEEMVEDDQFDKMRKVAEALARSARATVEYQAFKVINDGFSVTTGPDAVYLFSASHPLVKSGGTQSNLLTAADLSFTSLSTAVTTMSGLLDEAGLPVNQKGGILVVAPANELNAIQLLQSTSEPGTMNNDVNPLLKANSGANRMRLLVSPYITDIDSWFLFPDKEDHNFNLFWRSKPRRRNGVDERGTQNLWWNIRERFSAGYTHYFPVLGNAGA